MGAGIEPQRQVVEERREPRDEPDERVRVGGSCDLGGQASGPPCGRPRRVEPRDQLGALVAERDPQRPRVFVGAHARDGRVEPRGKPVHRGGHLVAQQRGQLRKRAVDVGAAICVDVERERAQPLAQRVARPGEEAADVVGVGWSEQRAIAVEAEQLAQRARSVSAPRLQRVPRQQPQQLDQLGHRDAETEIGCRRIGRREDERHRSRLVVVDRHAHVLDAGGHAERRARSPGGNAANRADLEADARAGVRVGDRLQGRRELLAPDHADRGSAGGRQIERQQLGREPRRPRADRRLGDEAEAQPLLAGRRRRVARVPRRQVERQRLLCGDFLPPRIGGRARPAQRAGQTHHRTELGE